MIHFFSKYLKITNIKLQNPNNFQITKSKTQNRLKYITFVCLKNSLL